MANAVGGQQQASGVPFVITANIAKKIKHSLLADLIIDKVLINSASPIRIDTIPISRVSPCPRWFAYVIVNKGPTSVLAQMKCAVVAPILI